MPKISVIMPAYNAEKYIAEAIDSILGQTYGDFEFIILNDCSKDCTEEIILSYKDPRIVYIKNEENLGVASTLNKGLAIATGEYIARMDADDISLPWRFEKQIRRLEEEPLLAAVGSDAIIFSEDGKQQHTNVPVGFQNIKIRMPISNPFIHPTMMMRRSMLSGMEYEHEFEGREDYRFWMRLSQKHPMDNVPEQLLRYRFHIKQATQKKDDNRQKKHFYLKKRYFEELPADISNDMTEALCMAAYYGYVRNEKQAYDLKAGLWALSIYLGEKTMPAEYEKLALGCAKKAGMRKAELWLFTKGMSIKARVNSML